MGEILDGRAARDHTMDTDVVVIGSGAGGAVASHALARRGLSVVILEAGRHHRSTDFTQREDEMLPALYEERGQQRTSDGLVTVLQARTVGGSTVVNTADCTPIPESVLERWRREFAVDLDAVALGPAYARVRAMLGVRSIEARETNPNNQRLLEGARRLGWRGGLFEHNRTGCTGSGYCLIGCAYDAKRSALVTYIPAALESGAVLVTEAEAIRVRVEGGAARGVEARWGAEARRLRIRSRHVVVAAGSIRTPLLLLRSDLGRGIEHLGRNLSLQPQAAVMARFEDELNSFRGIPQSAYVDEFEKFDPRVGLGGFRIEGIFAGPAQFATLVGGVGASHRTAMEAYARSAASLVLAPDQPAGRVVIDRGRPRIDYRLHGEVADRLRHGVAAAARAWFAAGAQVVGSPLGGGIVMTSERQIEDVLRASIVPGRTRLISAHPQGTVRMSEDARRGAVDSRGRYHGVDGLTVCDGSVFPTSSSSHTQIPIMAFADLAAEAIP
jgi:choline dehydrogenase-like flavoprotein